MRAAVLCMVVALGCSDDVAGVPDGRPKDAPIDAIKPSCVFNPPAAPTGGMVELGASSPPELVTFEPVMANGTFQVYAGPQGGYHLWIHVRLKSIDPGDGADLLTRPQTRISVFTADGTRVNIDDCGYRFAYRDTGDGYLTLDQAWLNQILSSVGAFIDMTPLRLTVQVLDRQGNYAVDERMVNALRPIPTPIGP